MSNKIEETVKKMNQPPGSTINFVFTGFTLLLKQEIQYDSQIPNAVKQSKINKSWWE